MANAVLRGHSLWMLTQWRQYCGNWVEKVMEPVVVVMIRVLGVYPGFKVVNFSFSMYLHWDPTFDHQKWLQRWHQDRGLRIRGRGRI